MHQEKAKEELCHLIMNGKLTIFTPVIRVAQIVMRMHKCFQEKKTGKNGISFHNEERSMMKCIITMLIG